MSSYYPLSRDDIKYLARLISETDIDMDVDFGK